MTKNEQKQDEEEPIQEEEINEIGEQETEILKIALAKCEKEKQEFLDLAKSLKADFANLKKEQEKNMDEFRKFAQKDLLIKLLAILDSFELAFKEIPGNIAGNGWLAGIKNIKSQFDSLLKNAGVEEISSVGIKFDPSLHEAVAHEELPEREDDEIIDELQKGYKLHDKVIRAAKVKVAVKNHRT